MKNAANRIADARSEQWLRMTAVIPNPVCGCYARTVDKKAAKVVPLHPAHGWLDGSHNRTTNPSDT